MAKLILKLSFLFILTILLSIQISVSIETENQDLTQQVMNNQEISKSLIISPDYGKIPLYFIPNEGQVDEKALFYANASRYTLWITREGLIFDSVRIIKKKDPKNKVFNPRERRDPKDSKHDRDVSRLVFLNSNKEPEVVPVDVTEHKVNYFIGNDKSKWRTNIQTSRAVLYKDIYRNIDLKVYGVEKQIEYDFIVKPGGEVSDIAFEYRDIQKTKIDKEGNLLIKTKFCELAHAKPVCYQVIEGKRLKVKAKFKKVEHNTYGFEVKEYKKNYELVIDPLVLVYSTYLGGNSIERGRSIAVDSEGAAYVTGSTDSDDFPVKSPIQGYYAGNYDIFITKINPSGTAIVYSTYLGGSSGDSGQGIAVDSEGAAYVTGYTESIDFPTQNPIQESMLGDNDVFITKINLSGTVLIYSTYLGGSVNEYGFGITVDSVGAAYVTGYTYSDDFPTQNPFQGSLARWEDVFITKINSAGSALVYSTYLGGSHNDVGHSIAVDSAGAAYVTGYTYSDDFPTKNPIQGSNAGDSDVFITKINSVGSALVYSTYLGSYDWDEGSGIAVDSAGAAYVTGTYVAGDFPWGHPRDIFVVKVNSAGSALIYSIYEEGWKSWKMSTSIAVDSGGTAYVIGWSEPDYFFTQNSIQNVFIANINPTGTSSVYFNNLCGSSDDYGAGIAVDGSGNVYVTGFTESSDFPTTSGAYDRSHNGDYDVFITKLLIPYLLPIFDGHDFTGNGRSDISVWRPSSGIWYIKGQTAQGWGTAGDIPVNGDYNGDNVTDVAVWRSSTGRWFVKSQTGSFWGTAGDIPVPGDYNGDGVTDYAVWRPSTGRWFVKGQTGTFWGTAGDIPVPGDYNGDGKTGYAVWRPSTGRWYIRGQIGAGWGQSGDIPVPGDYNGDGTSDIAVWRPSNGIWYIKGIGGFGWGQSGDIPVPGDYNGDGITDIAVWRPSTGRWYIRGQIGAGWGTLGDIPLVR